MSFLPCCSVARCFVTVASNNHQTMGGMGVTGAFVGLLFLGGKCGPSGCSLGTPPSWRAKGVPLPAALASFCGMSQAKRCAQELVLSAVLQLPGGPFPPASWRTTDASVGNPVAKQEHDELIEGRVNGLDSGVQVLEWARSECRRRSCRKRAGRRVTGRRARQASPTPIAPTVATPIVAAAVDLL